MVTLGAQATDMQSLRGNLFSVQVKALSQAERGGQELGMQKSDNMAWPIASHLEGYVFVHRPVASVSTYHLTNGLVRLDPPILPRGITLCHVFPCPILW